MWGQPLSDDGTTLTGKRSELIRNDVAWKGQVVEGAFVLRECLVTAIESSTRALVQCSRMRPNFSGVWNDGFPVGRQHSSIRFGDGPWILYRLIRS